MTDPSPAGCHRRSLGRLTASAIVHIHSKVTTAKRKSEIHPDRVSEAEMAKLEAAIDRAGYEGILQLTITRQCLDADKISWRR